MAEGYVFRCTYCNRIITRTLTKRDLGLAPTEDFVPGKSYNYTGCWCGWGKYVICEEMKKDSAVEIGDDHDGL